MKRDTLPKALAILALLATLAGCAVENMTVHNFRTMGMDGDSAAAVSAVVDKLAE